MSEILSWHVTVDNDGEPRARRTAAPREFAAEETVDYLPYLQE